MSTKVHLDCQVECNALTEQTKKKKEEKREWACTEEIAGQEKHRTRREEYIFPAIVHGPFGPFGAGINVRSLTIF